MLETPENDDTISYVEATCHLGDYDRMVQTKAPPFAEWMTAGDWQRLWSVEDRFCFPRIARDLGRGDIHPPLYFWLLHLWVLAFGTGVRSGPALNVVLAAGTVVLVYLLGRYLSKTHAATIGTLIWAVSPAALSITLVARQYELLSLLAVAFAWQVLRLSEPQRTPAAWELLLLTLTAAAGLLTHYHFLLLLVAASATGVWRLRRSTARRRLVLLAAIGAGTVVLPVVHPYIFESFVRSPNRPRDFGAAAIAGRALKTFAAVANFGGFGMVRPLWVASVAAAAASLFAMFRRRRGANEAVQSSAPLLELFAIVIGLWGAIAILYVASMSPQHAIRLRHLGMVWPLLALVVTGLLWRHRWGRWLAGVLCVALLAASASRLAESGGFDDAGVMSDSRESVLVDTVALGLLPRILWHLAPRTRVYAASQEHLLRHQEDWLDGIGDRCLYVSSLLFGNTEWGHRRVLARLRTRYEVTPGPRHSTLSETFRLRRLDGAEPRSPRSAP